MAFRLLLLLSLPAVGLSLSGCIFDDEIKLGAVATLQGSLSILGQDAMRGVDLALQEHGYQAGGRQISAVAASSDATPESAIDAARKLIEEQGIDIVIGPLASNEGLAIREYAKTQQKKTFVNGAAADPEVTLQDPATNFFRFTPDAVQWQAGLGRYAFAEADDKQGYRKVVTVAEDYPLGYSQVNGFMLEYCQAGGKVVDKLWLSLEDRDIDAIVAAIPQDIDAIYVALSSASAREFFSRYREQGGVKPFIAGALTIDQNMLLNQDGEYDYLIGTLSAGPLANAWDDADWQKFVQLYQEKFWQSETATAAAQQPDADADDQQLQTALQTQLSLRFRSPTLFSYSYYVNTKAVLLALELVNGDLSNDQVAFRSALAELSYKSPTGMIRLDQNHQAIANIFVTRISKDANGLFQQQVVGIAREINQTLGMNKNQFTGLSAGKDSIECP